MARKSKSTSPRRKSASKSTARKGSGLSLQSLSKRLDTVAVTLDDHNQRLNGHDEFIVESSKEIDDINRRLKGLEAVSNSLFASASPSTFTAFRPTSRN